MNGTLVLLSGGMDSTALLALTMARPEPVAALSVDYGQRHAVELKAAAAVANHYGVGHTVLDLSSLAPHLHSALTGTVDVPHGHYSANTMAATIVPNRNAIMLMCAVGVAASMGYSVVATAVHAGDHPVYPDCRPEFIRAASRVAQLGTDGIGNVIITAPFKRMTKAEVVKVGDHHDAPFELSWSCYEGGSIHCGRCGTCVERAEAFHLAGVNDPTLYLDPTYWQSVTS